MLSGGALASPAAHETPNISPPRRFDPAVLALLALTGLVHLITLRAGQPWHDDFALYVLHARNLVEGRPYGNTGFIYNSADPWHSPAVYPPGFPLLLAPVYAAFGANLFALRIIVIGSAVAAVGVFVLLARPVLPSSAVYAAAALLGLQPFLLRFKNLLLPDLTFVLVVLLSLHLLRSLHAEGARPRGGTARALLTGGCVYFALSLRTAGVALFGAIVLYHLLRREWPSGQVRLALLAALLLYAAQVAVMPSGSGYVAQLTDVRSGPTEVVSGTVSEVVAPEAATATPAEQAAAESPGAAVPEPVLLPSDPRGESLPLPLRLLRRSARFVAASDVLWTSRGDLWGDPLHGLEKWWVRMLIIMTTGLALAGFAARLRSVSIIETFAIAYFGIVVAWGFPSSRYIVPLIPLLIYYGAVGTRLLADRGRVAGRVVATAVVLLVSVSYALNLPRLPRVRYNQGVTSPAAREMFDFVQRCTPAEARFITYRPRAMALFTGREATSLPVGGSFLVSQDVLAREIDGRGVDHVLARPGSRLDSMSAVLPGFRRVFENQRHTVHSSAHGVISAADEAACGGTGITSIP